MPAIFPPEFFSPSTNPSPVVVVSTRGNAAWRAQATRGCRSTSSLTASRVRRRRWGGRARAAHLAGPAEWLLDRKWVAADHAAQSREIRALITAALQDMPEGVPALDALLAGSYITYFTCSRIVELLRVSEADSRNVFGRYSSQRMKDWLEIVRRYQLNNVYLGESSQLLQHQ